MPNVITEYSYNGDNRLVELVVKNEDTGDQVTRWEYGTTLEESRIASYDLLRVKVFPDSDDEVGPVGDGVDEEYDRVEYRYNRLGELIGLKDQNETEHEYEYDGLGRLVHDRVTVLGEGIDERVRRISREYEVRGLLSKVTSWSEEDPEEGEVVNEVSYAYNGFEKLIEEKQAHSGAVGEESPKVGYDYLDGSGNQTRLISTTYPNGRVIERSYGESGSISDATGQVEAIGEGEEVLARYTRRGVKSTVRIEYASASTELTYIKQSGELNGDAGDQYTGLDRFNRICDIRWLKTGTTTHLEWVKYEFDRASNRTHRVMPLMSDLGESYEYDGRYQLLELMRGGSGPTSQEEFSYDAAGNWKEYEKRTNGTVTLEQTRTHNLGNEIAGINGSGTLVGYDRAGNMTLMPRVGSWAAGQSCTWDAWNRLVKIEEGSAAVGQYEYDGLTRRTVKKSWVGGTPQERHYYYSNEWQVLEERVGSGEEAVRQYVWGTRYIDDLILRDRPDSSPSRLYALHDQWHVTAVSNSLAEVQERFIYSAFGETQVLSAEYEPQPDVFEWETRYGAYRYDLESGLYAVRYRYLHPGLGRWLSRDPIEEEGGLNLFAYVADRPTNFVDTDGQRISPHNPPPKPQSLPAPPNGKCRIEVCCKPVATFGSAHCVIRFTRSDGSVSGCRGGPTGKGNSSGPNHGNRQSAPCKGCCGAWGNIVAGCGGGRDDDSDPLAKGIWEDLKAAKSNPGQCSLIEESTAACGVEACVAREMQKITAGCYVYHPSGPNSNTAWYQSLKSCGHKFDPPGFQPGRNSQLSQARTCTN